MKEIRWVGRSYADLCAFPETVKQAAGFQLHLVQSGQQPPDWKPMKMIGAGVHEIRIRRGREYRIIYVAHFEEAVYVLHAFEKKTKKTEQEDIHLARERYKVIQKLRSRF